MTNNAPIFTFAAKTDIWTGDADRKSDSLKHTGLLGSIRWWFEVVIRGLGGYACDPSKTECSDKNHFETKCKDKKPCVVCELFGCTGWARKFRFDVLDERDAHIQEQIKADDVFKLKFTPLRPIQEEEWALLSLTLKLIARYGAIGGKTIHKPSDEIHKDKLHHKDFGLVKLNAQPYFRKETIEGITELKNYVIASQWRKNDRENFWASLENFWCVRNNFLEFGSFNIVLKEFEWLAGKQQESKRIFSFRNPPRTFGFVNSSKNLTHEAMIEKLKNRAWNRLTDEEYIRGVDKILTSLIQQLRRSKS